MKTTKMMKANVKHYMKVLEVSDYVALCHEPELTEQACRACRNYGRCWTCPPFDYDVLSRVRRYAWVLVVGAQIVPDEVLRNSPSSPTERNELARRLIEMAWKQCTEPMMRAMERKHADSRLLCGFFACGECSAHCARIDGRPCRHPELMRPSLEAYGFDVTRTTSELLGLELKWGVENALPEYTTLVTALLTHERPEEPAAERWELTL